MSGRGAAARREQGRQEMRLAILDAARRIADEEGIGNLSMRAIARAIGYSPAALYEYFPAKEDVCRALYFERAGGLNDRMRETMASLPADVSTRDAFDALGRAYRQYAHEQPELYRLIFGGSMIGFTPGDKERHQSREGFEILIDAARRGVERGDLLPMPPEEIAFSAWSGVHGFVMLELSGFLIADDREALFDTHLNLIAMGTLRR